MRGNTRTRQWSEGIAPFLRHGYIGGAAEARAVPCASRSHAQARFFPLVPGVACMSRSDSSSVLSVTTAFLLAQSEDFAVIDRRALREAGVGHVRVLTCGVCAARELAGHAKKEKNDQGALPDVVLVQHQLADMTGAEFVELARSHPRLADLPILHISSSETTQEEIEALAQGYSGVLARPYSRENMRLALEYAAAVKQDREKLGPGRALLNTELFDKALERFEARALIDHSDAPEQDVEVLPRALRDRSPAMADRLAGEAREETGEQRRRMPGSRQRAQAAAKPLFARGVPLLETNEEDAALPYRPGSRPLAIEPLAETSAADEKPGMNDALTVARLTWKIFRSAKL